MYSELRQVELPLVKTLEKLGWKYIKSADLEPLRDSFDNPFIISYLKESIVKLNSDKGVTESNADSIIHKLIRVETNEEFSKWLKGEKSVKLNQGEKAVTISLIDFDDLSNNQYLATNQFTQSITHGVNENEKNIRPDIILFINGIPTTVIECKVIAKEGSTWQEGIKQLKRYQKHSPKLFMPNVFNVSTDGHVFKYGATNAPSKFYFEWKYDNGLPANFDEDTSEFQSLEDEQAYNPFIDKSVYGMLNHGTYLDLLQNFVVFETVDDVTIKKIARYQQVRATNKIMNRVLSNDLKTGLVWHTQGSGKSLTMLFTAWKLRKHPQLNNPTILLVVDRKDLDTQISGTFAASKLPNTTRANSIRDLKRRIEEDRREVIITTIFKFSEMQGILANRENIIVLIDEAHRSQEGLNAIEMRKTLPKAYWFGFTGTPIDRADKNTHRNFGLRPDGNIERYLDLYNIRQAIEDGATVPVHYQLRNSEWHMDGVNLDKILSEEYSFMEDEELEELKTQAGKFATFMMNPARLQSIAEDIAEHFKNHVEPNNYKAQVVCFTRKACVIIKNHLDRLLGAEISDIVFTGSQNDDDELRRFHHTSEEQKDIVRRFKKHEEPLKILLVQSMLLTGFDAPVEQVMYLDRPLRDHTLLQAIARTNRPYKDKVCGMIIDYCGILKRLKDALNFDESDIEKCLIDFDELKSKLPDFIDEFKNIFTDVDISNLWKCLKHIKDNRLENRVMDVYKSIQLTYETIAPDPFVLDYHNDYKWATEVVLAWKQMTGGGGGRPPVDEEYLANTRKLIQEHVDIGRINQTAPLFVVDDNYLRRIDELPPDREQREILIEGRIRAIISVRIGNLPIYKSLMERLDEIIKHKDSDVQETLELLKKLTGEVNEAMKEEAAMGLSKGELAINQLVNEKIESQKKSELAQIINELIKKHTFNGWQVQRTVHAGIKRDIILELAKYAKAHPDLDINPDDYSEFSKEAMKYIEMHF